jgi:hypothetical protein
MRRIGILAVWGAILVLAFSATAVAQEPAGSEVQAATTITVRTSRDFNTSKSEICSGRPENECSLRRAIVEARTAPKPVTIQFNLSTRDPGYDSTLKVWVLEIKKSTSDIFTFRRLNGQITIDGTTQPNGRDDGPTIFLRSPDPGRDGLLVGDVAGDDEHTIRGLGFQNFDTHILLNTDNNVIEDNWFGLTEDGKDVYVRNSNLEDGSGSAGIGFGGGTTGAEDNIVRNNVFAGFDGVAVAVRGNRNTFENNLVGTRSDGTIPDVPAGQRCENGTWLGGGGISVEGGAASAAGAHTVRNNVFAGLRQEIFAKSTQPDAIRVAGDYYDIHSNKIGVDGNGKHVFVCGRGVLLLGANTPEFTTVAENVIVNPGMSGISVNGKLTDGNTLTKNVIIQDGAWPQNEDDLKPEPETAIQMGPEVPDALAQFEPAKVTKIEGTQVSGTAGVGSPCPNCIIEVFLDDTDDVTEAKEFLATATAKSNGTWAATLPRALNAGEGLRTTSTTAANNVIPGMSAGTTTKLSEGGEGLYTEAQKVMLPCILK